MTVSQGVILAEVALKAEQLKKMAEQLDVFQITLFPRTEVSLYSEVFLSVFPPGEYQIKKTDGNWYYLEAIMNGIAFVAAVEKKKIDPVGSSQGDPQEENLDPAGSCVVQE